MIEIRPIPAYQIRRARQLIVQTVEINNDSYMKDEFEKKIATAKKEVYSKVGNHPTPTN